MAIAKRTTGQTAEEFTAHWLDLRSSDSTSLRASGARVHGVLAEIGVSG